MTSISFLSEFVCHDGGATALGYSLTRQRLFSGGKKGEICIFDIRQFSLLHCISVHSSSINCIAVNDIDGYFVTGASDGDIKVGTVEPPIKDTLKEADLPTKDSINCIYYTRSNSSGNAKDSPLYNTLLLCTERGQTFLQSPKCVLHSQIGVSFFCTHR